MQRTTHHAHKTATYDARVFAQPTRHSIAAALAAQRRERELFAKTTGSHVDRDGRMSHVPTRRD
jgi:hypothetical protein